MKIRNYEYASHPQTGKSCLLYFDENCTNCAFLFDVPAPEMGTEFPEPLRDSKLLCQALRPPRKLQPNQQYYWVSMELLRLWVNDCPIPVDDESGINRYFRGHPEAA